MPFIWKKITFSYLRQKDFVYTYNFEEKTVKWMWCVERLSFKRLEMLRANVCKTEGILNRVNERTSYESTYN